MGQVIEQIKKLFQSIKAFWGKQDKKNRIKIVVGIVAAIALIAFVVVLMNQTKYTTLYSGIDQDERVEVEKYLEESNIAYKIEGNDILVDEAQESAVRMELSNLGHPYSTPNYDFYFNKVGTMTTADERELIEKYQLNQRLADVIETIDGVESATVTIAYPNGSGYVLSESADDEVKAGVTVTFAPGVKLTQKQVNGIVNLISTSVPKLKPANVSVLDTSTGETLNATDGSSSTAATSDASSLKRDVEKAYENDIENKVLSVLRPIYAENVKVAVKCSIDINDSIKEIVTYIPSEDNKGVITKEDLANAIQNEGGSVGGLTGTDTNAETGNNNEPSTDNPNNVAENEDVTTYPSIKVGGDTIYLQDEKSYDYLVSYVKEKVQKTAGEVDGLNVSVILNKESIPDSKRQELTRLVANSAAIESEKVVIYTDLFETSDNGLMPGTPDNPFEEYPWLIYVIAGAGVLLLLIIIILAARSKRKKKKKAAELAAAEGEEAMTNQPQTPPELSLDAEQLEEIQDIKVAKGMVMKQKIQEFSKENPDIAAQLVKSWLRGEDE